MDNWASRLTVLSLVAMMILLLGSSYALAEKNCNVEKLREDIKQIEVGGGCIGVGAAWYAICEGGTLGLGTPGCVVIGMALEGSCVAFGEHYIKEPSKGFCQYLCDLAGYVDNAPHVIVINRLKDHKVDFRIDRKGNDVHMRGNDWLEPGHVGVLASEKISDKHTYTVKARVKRDGFEKDIHLEIKDVKPNSKAVYIHYKNGKYELGLTEREYAAMPHIRVKNDLKNHDVNFRIERKGNDIHLANKNWLGPGKERKLISNKLDEKETYTVHARVRRDGHDINLEIFHVAPNKDEVVVFFENDNYQIKKKDVE